MILLPGSSNLRSIVSLLFLNERWRWICSKSNWFLAAPAALLTLCNICLIMAMIWGIFSLSGCVKPVRSCILSNNNVYLPSRVVGLVKYPFNSSLRDDTSLSVCYRSLVRDLQGNYLQPYLSKQCKFWVIKSLMLIGVLCLMLSCAIVHKRLEFSHKVLHNITDL
jgi:hypothetical protein